MWIYRIICFCFVFIHIVVETRAGGRGFLRFLEYNSPRHTDASGSCCDWGRSCPNDCDVLFEICLSMAPLKDCAIYNRKSKKQGDTDHIVFSDKIIDLPNPIVFTFQKWTTLNILIKVWDSDSGEFMGGADDLMGEIETQKTLLGYNATPSHPPQKGLFTDPVITITYEYSSMCDANYFGDCSVLCIPETGHYTCNATTGEKICDRGFIGPDCIIPDPCINNSCHDSSTCVPLVPNYTCLCVNDRTGTFCQDEITSTTEILTTTETTTTTKMTTTAKFSQPGTSTNVLEITTKSTMTSASSISNYYPYVNITNSTPLIVQNITNGVLPDSTNKEPTTKTPSHSFKKTEQFQTSVNTHIGSGATQSIKSAVSPTRTTKDINKPGLYNAQFSKENEEKEENHPTIYLIVGTVLAVALVSVILSFGVIKIRGRFKNRIDNLSHY